MMPDSCVIFSDRPGDGAVGDPAVAEGALPLAIVLDQRTVLIVGHLSKVPPATAVALLGDEAATGTWRATSWETGGGAGGHQLLAVLCAENIVRALTLPVVLHATSGVRVLLPEIVRVELDATPLLEHLRAAHADLAAAYDFVEHQLCGAAPQTPPSPRVLGLLRSFLEAISRHDGFVEIVGRSEGDGVLLQGWAMHLAAGTSDLHLRAGGLHRHQAKIACFERPDLLETARGFVAFMKLAGDVDPRLLRCVYFKADGAYCHLDVVDNCLVLNGETTAHLKEMLGRLQGPVDAVRALKRVCRPRFPGHETVSSMTVPVRLAQDIALCVTGGGLFLSGWLLDPRRSVAKVLLKSTRNFYARLDPIWERLPRPDVTSGYAADPLFAEWIRPWEHQHGFIAYVPRPQPVAADEVHYLEVVLEDESCAFLPVRFSEADPQELLRQILGGVNIDDPAIERIVGNHLAPLVSAVCAGASSGAAASTGNFGRPVSDPVVSMIVPLPAGWADFDINLARFATDPDVRQAELIVVAPREGGDHTARALRRFAPFYGLGGRLLLTAEPLDYHSALEAGAAAADSDLLLLLSPSVFPRDPGWLRRLIAELADPAVAAASPTLLYEDDSVCFAGDAEAFDRYHGYSHHWLDGEGSQPVAAGTGRCCIVRKQMFMALGGFSRAFVCADLRSRDFGLRLQQAGGAVHWIPGLQMSVVDDEASEPADYAMRVRRLVDKFGFARKWPAVAGSPLIA